MGRGVARKPETFFEEMKRYVGFTDEDAQFLQAVGPTMEAHFPALSDRFYHQIAQHPEAAKVFTHGQAQIDRLKRTLRNWAQGLFSGLYNEEYAAERCRIGVRHVADPKGLGQRPSVRCHPRESGGLVGFAKFTLQVQHLV